MKFNIVVDNKNNWFYQRAPQLKKKIQELGHECDFVSQHSRIKEGSKATFFLGCEQYITKKTRGKSEYNIVVHAGDLPKGRGMSPTTWQILEGKNEIPVTLFEVGDGYDDGSWYIKNKFKLNGTELITEWQEKLNKCMEEMVISFVKKINRIKGHLQKGKPTYYKRRTPEDSKLDVNKSIKDQFNLLRVVDNDRYPAFFVYKGNEYIIKVTKKNGK